MVKRRVLRAESEKPLAAEFLLVHRVTRVRDSDTWQYRNDLDGEGERSRRFGSSSRPDPRSAVETVKV